MKNSKRILAVMCILSIMALNAPLGHGACLQHGKVAYVAVTYLNPTSAYAYIYVAQQTAFPSYYTYYYTGNPSVIQAALSAQAGNLRVGINGNAEACATTGLTRPGGTITNIYVYSIY